MEKKERDKRENEGIFFGESCNTGLLGAAGGTPCAVPWPYAWQRLQLSLSGTAARSRPNRSCDFISFT